MTKNPCLISIKVMKSNPEILKFLKSPNIEEKLELCFIKTKSCILFLTIKAFVAIISSKKISYKTNFLLMILLLLSITKVCFYFDSCGN